jgi:UDP-glucose 4-epimerase
MLIERSPGAQRWLGLSGEGGGLVRAPISTAHRLAHPVVAARDARRGTPVRASLFVEDRGRRVGANALAETDGRKGDREDVVAPRGVWRGSSRGQPCVMRIVVTGATGNVGTSVVSALGQDGRVREIVGIARRLPRWTPPKVRWVAADVERDDLRSLFVGADAVIHLAWLIQPSRDEAELERVNVRGSRRVFEAAAEAGVPRLVHASSIGVYSAGPKHRRVDETWPRDGTQTSFYARHKAAAERALDTLEAAHPGLRVVRLRPGLVFKRDAGPEIRRLFGGPLVPAAALRPGLLALLPLPDRLVLQCVHGDDVGQAYRLAALSDDANGAYNIAADPVLDPATIARTLRSRRVRVPARALRVLAGAAWRLRLQPTPPGWVDMGLAVPVMDTRRAREQLGWSPRTSATEALLELLEGMRAPAGLDTPPLAPRAGGPLRVRELLTGVGRRT